VVALVYTDPETMVEAHRILTEAELATDFEVRATK
jgi:hypothetical protein